MKKVPFLLVIFTFLSIAAWSQTLASGPIGQWREHLPFTRGVSVAVSPEKVYCAAGNGIIILRKEDNSLERLSRSNGLSDINLTSLNYHQETQTLVIGYKNGNLDFVKDNNVVNVSDIKRSTIVQGGKTINNIRFIGDDAYICSNFGIVVFDMIKREVRNTLFPSLLNPEIHDVVSRNGRIYAATSKGVFSADINNPQLPYYVAWTLDPVIGNRPIRSVAYLQGDWYAARYVTTEDELDTLFRVRNNNLEIFQTQGQVVSLKADDDQLLVCNSYNVNVYSDSGNTLNSLNSYGNNRPSPTPSEAAFDTENPTVFWVADRGLGLVRSAEIFTIDSYTPEGPPSANVFNMDYSNGALWVAPGAWDIAYSPIYLIDGVFRYQNGEWDAFQLPTNNDYVRDVVSVKIDPADNQHVFAASWGTGLAELRNGAIADTFNSFNGVLVGLPDYPTDIRLADVEMDSDGRVWISSSSSAKPIQMRETDGTWRGFSFSSLINNQFVGDLMIDSIGQKWMIVQNRGLMVANIDDGTVNSFKLLTDQVGNGAMSSSIVLCMAQDQEGQVWVGTSKGVSVFYSPEAILQSGTNVNWDSQKIIVSQGGFNQYLLESEEVTSILVDGANRKWLGTRNAGLFLVSANGEEQLQHFTSENSPLLSNTIVALEMNGETGELFIGTNIGICSYRTDATSGSNAFQHVYAFPNPVERGYSGPIAITGLVRDADVKITDVSGNIVFTTRSNGGTAIWNGNMYSGQRAATGVYLVFCTNDNGEQTNVTKILLLN